MKYKVLVSLLVISLVTNISLILYHRHFVFKHDFQIFAMRAHESVLLYTAVAGILKNDDKKTIITMLSYDFDPFDNALGENACDIAKKLNRTDFIDILNKHKNSQKYPKRCE